MISWPTVDFQYRAVQIDKLQIIFVQIYMENLSFSCFGEGSLLPITLNT